MKSNKNTANNKKLVKTAIKNQYQNNKITLIVSAVFIAFSFLLDKLIIQLINVIEYPILFKLFYIITLLGEPYVYIWIILFLTIALIINNHSIKKFIITIIVGAVSEFILKTIINRPRPFEALNVSSTVSTSMSSFPSGHTMMFFVMIPYLTNKFPKITIPLWTISILVGFSRIYLGVHYFSDVVAGAIIGYFIGLMILQIGEKNVKKN